MRAEIIDAAMELLTRSGYPALTMEEIAEKAQLSTASLYKYFPGKKEEINAKLIDRALQLDKQHLDHAFDSSKSPVDELTAVGWAYLDFGLTFPGYFQVVAQPTNFGFEDEQAKLIAERVEALLDRVGDIVRRGQSDEGPAGPTFPDDKLDADKIAQVLHGAWNGLIGLSLRNDDLQRDRDQLKQLAEVAIHIVRRGLLSAPD